MFNVKELEIQKKLKKVCYGLIYLCPLILFSLLIILSGSLIVVLLNQVHGTYFRNFYLNCEILDEAISKVDNVECDGGLLNIYACGFGRLRRHISKIYNYKF
jgi:hypothetical protein